MFHIKAVMRPAVVPFNQVVQFRHKTPFALCFVLQYKKAGNITTLNRKIPLPLKKQRFFSFFPCEACLNRLNKYIYVYFDKQADQAYNQFFTAGLIQAA
jgi:hypothetical protein